MIELEKIYRQKDLEFIHLLNKIRNNSVEDSDIETLNQRYEGIKQKEGEFCINLTSTNSKADQINAEYLAKIKGASYKSTAVISGDFDKSSYPTASELEYKIGSQIMMLNNDSGNRWVNGSIGVIEKRQKDGNGEIYLVIKFPDKNRSYAIKEHKWEISRYYFDGKKIDSEVVGGFEQFPFRLAWAITIHKSQGKTFDNVVIDIGNEIFATGQMYVALSRCTSFEGIILKNLIRKHHIRTDYKIFKFLTDHQYKKSEMEHPIENKVILIEQAIQDKKEIDLTYLKANDIKSQRVVVPYYIGQEKYHGKAFIVLKAYCKEKREKRIFMVDRILKMEVID
jgi:ATP-dependent exoDNAse (exonuclease V) alpha subunit